MRLFACAIFLCAIALAADSIDAFGHRWTVQNPADWAIVSPTEISLKIPGTPPPGIPRRPQKFAIAETEPFRKVTIEAEIRRAKRSLILVYAWQDKDHFNYAHISSDSAATQAHHNGMFHVFGGERVRISALDGPASLPTQDWIPVKLVFDGDSGRCYVEVAGKRNPSLDAVDLSLRHGRVGLGSFDETGDFRNVKIKGEPKSNPAVGHQ